MILSRSQRNSRMAKKAMTPITIPAMAPPDKLLPLEPLESLDERVPRDFSFSALDGDGVAVATDCHRKLR